MKDWVRTAFVLHFLVDWMVAVPLFFVPMWSMELFGVEGDLILARMVAAALFAIGTVSLMAHKRGQESYRSLLELKLIWSGLVIVSLTVALLEMYTIGLMVALIVFSAFAIAWWIAYAEFRR